MLKYSVRLSGDNFKRDELVWSEKYVSPDLSFISGVTSQDNHIDKNDLISASVGFDSNFSSLNVSATNVCRNGYALIEGKKYKIETGEKSTVDGGSFRYVEINGVYYYITGGTITVKNWLVPEWTEVDDEYKINVAERDVTVNVSGDYIKLDTVAWIEDETVSIDGHTYIYDKYDCNGGGIKYYKDGVCLEPSEITDCDDIIYNHFDNASEYLYVTKFVLSKHDDERLAYDNLSFCTYFYYVFYKDNYCAIKSINGSYKCLIPNWLLNDNPGETGTTQLPVSSVTGEFPSRISQLKSYDVYVDINGSKYPVENTLQNANSGDEVAVYLTNGTENVSIGDKITFSYQTGDETVFPIYAINGNGFVLYDNVKYMVEDKIADTVKINGVEYDIEYPDGKEDGEDALVHIENEKIPMKIINGESKLERYGYIVLNGNSQAGQQTYSIKSYDGVRINGTVYRVDEQGDFITTNMPYINEFQITNIEGSSMLICTPYLNTQEYDTDFIDEMSQYLCDFYINRYNYTYIYSKNRAFGQRAITPSIGFASNPSAVSSNDYYDLFDNLVLYANSGYIQIKLPFTMNVANNALQEDIVNRDFFEAEKEKAINDIVDMEKDVYVPMFMEGGYSGSTTDFFTISEIDVNLHFRSRRGDSWKVKDKNVNVEDDGDDNWFCTDYYPYKQLLASGGTSASTILMNTSDLVGLLYFDNDDVFYQKSNIEKSFLRFSYYDSPDPNTQSLLYTSTVFMDEHAIYKKYVDNSRRNVNYYGVVDETKYLYEEDGSKTEDIEFSGKTINRISVSGECLTVKKTTYTPEDIDMEKLSGDTSRTSSRFVIKNKYATDTSAEGFYVYIFREYSENLYPKPIYMKVEFNHAGVGRTIPFIIPMRWDTNTEDEDDNEMFPVSALTLDGEDLTYLKKGYPLSYVYAQTYIPLYAVYDFKHKKYAYVFDDRYVKMEDSKIILNMFELKIKDENDYTEEKLARARAAVRNNNIERANINVNTSQFPDNI